MAKPLTADSPVAVDAGRDLLVRECLADIRGYVGEGGVTRATLDRVKARLIRLAARRDLFSCDRFPVQAGDGLTSLYLLSEDDDHGYALYAVAERKGQMSPPHDHTTWAVIAGIEGEEVNRFYRRLDDGRQPGRAQIQQTHQETVAAGTGVALMPEDIHSIHCLIDGPTLNFHLYGRSIEHLPARKAFNMRDGSYHYFPPHPHIHK